MTACDGKQDLQVRPQLLRTVNSLSQSRGGARGGMIPSPLSSQTTVTTSASPPPALICVPIIACVAAGLAGAANAPGATRWLYCMYLGRIHRQDSGWGYESFLILVVQILPEEGPIMSLPDMDYRG
jgi:hypothetical protein